MDMNANFAQLKVPDLKKYLQRRGIPVSNKHREEPLDLSIKAHELCIEDLDDDHWEKQPPMFTIRRF